MVQGRMDETEGQQEMKIRDEFEEGRRDGSADRRLVFASNINFHVSHQYILVILQGDLIFFVLKCAKYRYCLIFINLFTFCAVTFVYFKSVI